MVVSGPRRRQVLRLCQSVLALSQGVHVPRLLFPRKMLLLFPNRKFFIYSRHLCSKMWRASVHTLSRGERLLLLRKFPVQENQFVTEIGSFQSDSYSLLGLKKTSISYVWLDWTYYNYSNFGKIVSCLKTGLGYENRNIGECVSLALRTEEVPVGKWTTSPCSGNSLVVVCEKGELMVPPKTSGRQI